MEFPVSYQLISYLSDKPRLISRAIGASTFLTRLAGVALVNFSSLSPRIKYQIPVASSDGSLGRFVLTIRLAFTYLSLHNG